MVTCTIIAVNNRHTESFKFEAEYYTHIENQLAAHSPYRIYSHFWKKERKMFSIEFFIVRRMYTFTRLYQYIGYTTGLLFLSTTRLIAIVIV